MHLWIRGLLASIVSSASGGIMTGLASIGIDAEHFNLGQPQLLVKVMLTAALVNAFVGLAAYLKQSPLPPQ